MRDTELQINLSNLSHNLNILKEKTSSEIQGVLKAFSYGLEIREVVEVIDEHVSCYSVMSIDEAILVRNESTKPILLLQGVYDLDEYEKVLKYDLDIVIHSDWQLKNLDARLKNNRFWLKLNTGLNRLGFNPEKFDIIFADPPYDYSLQKLTEIVDLIFSEKSVTKGGIFLLEHNDKIEFSNHNLFHLKN